jgi:hypothetical protein
VVKLPRLSRTDRLLLGLLLPLALLAALATWWAMPPKKEGSWLGQPSTFFNDAHGTKAAYLALERLGVGVRRLREPIAAETLAGAAALVVLEPIEGLEKSETRALREWIERGHRLLVAPTVRPNPLAPSSGFFDQWFRTAPPAQAVVEPDGRITARSGVELDAGDELFAGIRTLVAGVDSRFPPGAAVIGALARAPVEDLWQDRYGVVALRVRLGDGEIIALSDTYPLSNRGLADADNALLLGNLARELEAGDPGGAIVFDELHQGFPLRDASWVVVARLMLEERWGWAVAQGVLVAALALYGAGVRFGAARDVVRRQRRRHGEFAEAAGRVLDAAGATGLAFETLWAHYRARLCRALHLPDDADDRALAGAAARTAALDLTPLVERAAACRAPCRPTRSQLLAMTSEMHRALEVLQHGN